jgi:hypothetical protein
VADEPASVRCFHQHVAAMAGNNQSGFE